MLKWIKKFSTQCKDSVIIPGLYPIITKARSPEVIYEATKTRLDGTPLKSTALKITFIADGKMTLLVPSVYEFICKLKEISQQYNIPYMKPKRTKNVTRKPKK